MARPHDFPHLEALRQAYDQQASFRATLHDLEWRRAVVDTWLDGLPPFPRLLELGPGTGQLAAYVQGRGAEVQAVELSPVNVEHCRARGVSARVGDFRALDELVGLGDFDGVYSINALLHVPRAQHAEVIAGARRHLRPSGSLLLVNWGGKDEEGVYEQDSCDPPRFFSLYADESFFALEIDGFRVERREVLTAQTPTGMHPQVLVLRRA